MSRLIPPGPPLGAGPPGGGAPAVGGAIPGPAGVVGMA